MTTENSLFQPLENNRPFFKAAFEGFAGDGKTFTATQVAIGIHKLIKSTKPIAIFDTEKAFKALKKVFDDNEIKAVVNDRDRSLTALSQAIKWCEEGNSDILLIDSITHVWEEYLTAYMTQKNRTRLEFQDWGVIKPRWKKEFSTPFVQAKCHIIFTGRAGYEYENEKNEETGKREIFKSGIKMKAENETAFEPDLLILMEKKQQLIGDNKQIHREAIIIKDRTAQIDGKTFVNPTFEDFYPAIKILLDGTLRETIGENIPDTFQEYENRFGDIGKKKDILISEIEGGFNLLGLGSSGKDKQFKSWILNQVYGKQSIEAVAKLSITAIESGYSIIKGYVSEYSKYLKDCIQSEKEPDPKHAQNLMKSLMVETEAKQS